MRNGLMRPGFWYLATPYSEYEAGIEEAFKEAAKIAGERFVKNGIPIFCPIAHGHPMTTEANIPVDRYDIWLPQDQPFMDAAIGLIVVQMPGWKESRGVKYEIDVFTEAGKPVVYMEWDESS